MVDANSETDFGSVSEATLDWMRRQLRSTAGQKAVISVSHQNLADHTSLFSYGFTAGRAEEVRQLYAQFQVKVNFSGHMHIQHIQKQQGLTDIASSSLSVAPLQYGIIHIDAGQKLTYQTRKLSDEELTAEARTFFEQSTARQVLPSLKEKKLSQAELSAMLELAESANNWIFDGTLGQRRDQIERNPAWSLWQNQGSDLFFGKYLNTMTAEAGEENNYAELLLK